MSKIEATYLIQPISSSDWGSSVSDQDVSSSANPQSYTMNVERNPPTQYQSVYMVPVPQSSAVSQSEQQISQSGQVSQQPQAVAAQTQQPTQQAFTSSTASAHQTSWLGPPKSSVTAVPTTSFSETNRILNSSLPVEVNETETITVNRETGIWANKADATNWQGPLPIHEYPINDDSNPEVIRKTSGQQITYIQEIAIRYLRPPSPPQPGEIRIRQERSVVPPPAPPLVIRQQPPRPVTPSPLVIREAPPRPLPQVPPKIITIPGKRIPPPPRKVIIERLAPIPSKPQNIIIERWLPYNQLKRRVVFEHAPEPDVQYEKPKNVIVQWESPRVSVKTEIKDLGVIRANPEEYIQKYSSSLTSSDQLPDYVKEIKPSSGLALAAQVTRPERFELEGDINALSLIDLDREGLSEYKSFVNSQSAQVSQPISSTQSRFGSENVSYGGVQSQPEFNQAFESAVKSSSDLITLDEGKRILSILNDKLGRSYDESKAESFVQELDHDKDGLIEFERFKSVVISAFQNA